MCEVSRAFHINLVNWTHLTVICYYLITITHSSSLYLLSGSLAAHQDLDV
jgi:hypothetical protein